MLNFTIKINLTVIRKTLLATGLFFTLNSYAQTTDTINWRANYKLKWSDFKKVPDSSSKSGAITSAGITYKIFPNLKDSSFSVKVYCYFNRANSWSKFKTSIIGLKHEQGHFDITELFARKFRVALKKITALKYNVAIYSDVNQILHGINKEQDIYHNLYDIETDYCNNVKQQLYWSKKILAEINKLTAYKQ